MMIETVKEEMDRCWRTGFTNEDCSPETVVAAERRLCDAIARRDAALTVIEVSREGPSLPTEMYVAFKLIHGDAEAEIEEARDELERAALLYAEATRQERIVMDDRRRWRRKRRSVRKTVLVDGIRTKLERSL